MRTSVIQALGRLPLFVGIEAGHLTYLTWPRGPRKAWTTGCFSLLILALTHSVTSLGVFPQLEREDNNNDPFNKGC